MTVEIENFKPYEYAKITATTTSGNVTFTGTGGNALRIYNSGTSIVYCAWGRGTQTAVSTGATPSYAIGAGHREFPGVDAPINFAAIALLGTSDVYVARGNGAPCGA